MTDTPAGDPPGDGVATLAPPVGAPGGPRGDVEPRRFGAAMLRRFGWFYYALGLSRVLGRVRLEEHSAEQIRTAAARGPIVYVLLQRSTLDHLALNTVLNQRRLPLSVWANGVTSFWWQPVADAWRDVLRRLQARLTGSLPDPVRSGWVSRAVAGGAPVTVFLTRGDATGALGLDGPDDGALDAVLAAQTSTERPIQLLPVLVVWNRAPDRAGNAVERFFSGIRRPPGFLGQLRNVLFRTEDAFVQVGEPLDLREVVSRVDVVRRTKALRTLLRRYLQREQKVVQGPKLLPRSVMKRLVLDNPPMRDLARREADAQGKSVERVQRQMARDFDRMAANFNWWTIQGLKAILNPLWTRIYSGVDVRDEDMDRIRQAMRDGSAVLVPSHKSHFDYLLLSWVLYQNDLIVPHVIAGMNLAIWPVSILLRGAGGFFVKRSFSGDRVFPAVFSRYLRELVRQGWPIEFFIEGGRTRSGKLLPPKLGVLGMVMDAAELRARGREVTLLPIAFAYEQVAEEAAYARELGGEKKQPESVGQLVKARSVLRRRYGRVYMRVGEPIRCGEIVDPSADRPAPWHERPRPQQKETLSRVGERVVHRIGRVTVVLPTSLVALGLLAHHRRGIKQTELVARIERLRAFLLRAGAMEAASLQTPSQAIVEALARFHRQQLVESLDGDGDRVWAVVVDKRITLDFHKNQVLHFFAPALYAAAAIRALPDAPFRADDARPGFVELCWLLRREFVLDPDRSATALLDDALEALEAHGALAREAPTSEGRGEPLPGHPSPDGPAWTGRWTVADPGRMGEIYGLARSLVEAYLFVVETVPALVGRGVERKDLAHALQSEPPDWISRPEALSLVTLQNALASLEEEGLLRWEDDRPRLHADLLDRARAALAPMVR